MGDERVEAEILSFVYLRTDGRLGDRVGFPVICGSLRLSADAVWEANANLVLAGLAVHVDHEVCLTERGIQEAAVAIGLFAHHFG